MKVNFDYDKQTDILYLEMTPENQYEWNWCKFLLKAIKEEYGYGYCFVDKTYDIKIHDWSICGSDLNDLFEQTVEDNIKNKK